MAPEALRRLDSKKSVLLVRGQYAAVLDKINFFTDGGYKRKAEAAAAFKAQLSVPAVRVDRPSEDWAADPSRTIAAPALGAKHDAAFARVMVAAEEIFVDAERFQVTFLAAMSEASNGSIAALCKELRTEPQSIGTLKRPRGFSIRRADRSDVLTKSLRAEIIAARNLLNADRAERAGVSTHVGTGSTDLGTAVPVLAPAAVTPSSPPVVVASASSGEVEKMLEPADMVPLVAGVSAEAAEWVKDVEAAVAPSLTEESRAAFEADIGRLHAMSALFQDTPDDLLELL